MEDAFDKNSAYRRGAGLHEREDEGTDCMLTQHAHQDPARKSASSITPIPHSREMSHLSMPHSRDFSRELMSGMQSAFCREFVPLNSTMQVGQRQNI